MQLPGRMFATAEAGISFGAGRPGHERGRDHDVEVGHPLLERGLLLRPAARASAPAHSRPRSPRRWTPSSRNLAPSDSTCSFTAGPHVECRDDGTEPPCGRDRLQARDAGAHHEHARGRDRARGGHQHREELRHPIGRDQHGLVPRDRRLGGEGVHGLGARDSGHRLHRERDHALALQPLDPLVIGERREEADENRARAASAATSSAVGRPTRRTAAAPSSTAPASRSVAPASA